MARRRYKKPRHEWPNGKELPKTNKVWASQIPPNGYKDFDKRIFLNRHIGISMMNIPDGTVLENSMPEQRNEMLGKEFYLKYKYNKNVLECCPKDLDIKWIKIDEQIWRSFWFYIDKFKVIRWDITDDIVILVNNEKRLIIVSEAKYVLDDGTESKNEYNKIAHNNYIHEIPIQDFRFLGKQVMCTYNDSDNRYHIGTIIRADITGFDRRCIILEDRGNSYRVVTIDEGYFFMQHGDIELNSSTTIKSIYENFWPKDWRNLAYD